MKWSMLLIALLVFLLPASAQNIIDACPAAVTSARELITQADTALAEDRYSDAETLLRDARQIVSRACSDSTLSIGGNSNLGATANITPPSANPSGGVAFIRVINTIPDSNTTSNVQLDGFGNVVTGVDYGQFTGLIPIPSGSQSFNGVNWDFPSNSTWVLAMTGLNETASVALQPISILRNNLNGKARVRVVQTISGMERIDVTSAEGTNFGKGLGWLGNHDIDIEPGDYTLRADTAGGRGVIPNTDFTFEANRSYTIFLIGSKENEPTPEFVTLESAQDTTRVRFINEREETVDVHYRPGNSKIVEGLATGATSDWVEIPTSAVTFIAYETGTGPTGQEKASLSEALRSGRDLTLSIGIDGTITVESVAFTQ